MRWSPTDCHDLVSESIQSGNGTVVHYAGDAVLAEFPTVTESLICAAHIQRSLAHKNNELPDDRKVQFRIGVNLGEVIVDRDDIYGDGVNVAARLETLAEPGGICISESVHSAVGNKLPLEYESLGEQSVKNIEKPVRAYHARLAPGAELPDIQSHAASGEARPRVSRRAAVALAVLFLTVVAGLFLWSPWETARETDSMEELAYPLPEKPSIAVLPFDNLSGDPDQDYFVDGFTNAIITNLSKFRDLFVIASNSVFTYKNNPKRFSEVGRALGIEYVLEGSVQRSGDTLSVHAQLIEALTETHIWAEQYDGSAEEIFQVQSELVRRIASSLASKIRSTEGAVALGKDATTLPAYDLMLRAREISARKRDYAETIRLLDRAVELDPDFADAHAMLGFFHLNQWRHRRAEDPDRALRLAREHTHKALELDSASSRAHFVSGALYLFDARDHALALAEFERSSSLNPNSADRMAWMSLLNSFMGKSEEAVEWIEKAKRHNPFHPAWYDWNASLAYYMARDYDKAVVAGKQTVAVYKKSISAYRILAATYVEMGRMKDAQAAAAKIMELKPKFTLSKVRNTPFQSESDLERYYNALRKSGLPE
jgi:adenylate cyclase